MMNNAEWQKELGRLEDIFNAWTLPIEPIKITPYVINNPRAYVETCLNNIRDKEPTVWKEANFHRLQQLERYLIENEGK